MAKKIGLLLPRSTDYPSIAFDIVEGMKSSSAFREEEHILLTDNTGFGENIAFIYSKAEKLFMDEIDILVCYSNASNAKSVYPLASTTGKPILFLDAGMQLPEILPPANCYHISLQGAHGCYLSGKAAGERSKKVLLAMSYFDAGFDGPLCYTMGIESAGGKVEGNYISPYKVAGFNIDEYLSQLKNLSAESSMPAVGACFTSYMGELFFSQLKEHSPSSVRSPFFCSPFMAEAMALSRSPFPGGEFHATVGWSSDLANEANKKFCSSLHDKNKTPGIFHLLGYEAAICIDKLLNGPGLENSGYESPRGNVKIHPETRNTFAPMYGAMIVEGTNGFCKLETAASIDVSAEDHAALFKRRLGEISQGWKNNFFCI